MSLKTTTAELKKMSLTELVKERNELQAQLAKISIGVTMKKEKNHAKIRGHRRQIARITMVIKSLERGGLNSKTTTATVSAPETPKKTKKSTSDSKTNA